MTPLRSLTLAAGLALAIIPAFAHGYELGALEIVHPWARATPKSAPVGGGYMTIVNTGSTPDRLLSVSADVSRTVELHEMSMEGGIMKMRAVDGGLVVPAGGKLELGPSGYHVMFVGLAAPLEAGKSFKGTLTFEKAGKIDVDFEIESMSAKPMDHSAGHMGGMPTAPSGPKPMGQ